MADFKGNRYMTHGVDVEIDLTLQVIMWSMIDENIAKGLKMDYLQVFKLNSVTRNGRGYQEIIHSQEQPKRQNKVTVDIGVFPISEKIFVIDSVEYVTMMLASEY